MQRMLEAEMTEHLGFEANDAQAGAAATACDLVTSARLVGAGAQDDHAST